ncbi:MAG: hypothetical protein D6775_15890 [Caldilineae bacterium]|nr:MAG: hypothetical protein D6775_15890 [Caldilineae bacterium]
MQPDANTTRALFEQLREAGVIVRLEETLPFPEALEVADALLAAPALGIVVAMPARHATAVLQALVHRGPGQTLLGAADVLSEQHVDAAARAGATFLVSTCFDLRLAVRARMLSLPYVPGAFTASEVALALRHGYDHLYYNPADILGPDHFASLRAAYPHCRFLVGGGLDPASLPAYAEAGAWAVVASSELLGRQSWTQADLIREVRLLRRIWEQALGRDTGAVRLR